ncbi:uncharacterized protein LOC131847930 [Achroia grisella]|uniref:uncharacterized protein LOC131847930 n=1 Tax=Achroia grisella TaxID=688607 RepID=UPI0027D2B01F|nr:uncharacterized protein LOC131847930 [Achroia grisella]
MDEALKMYRKNELGFNEACRKYKIPKPTFRRHLKGLNVNTKFGRPKYLTDEAENEFVQYLLAMEANFFSYSVTALRQLAYQFAEKHKLPHPGFNKAQKMAGKHWYYNFKKEYPLLFSRTLMAISPRNKKLCMGRVRDFYNKYEKILNEHNLGADRIYNIDSTTLSHADNELISKNRSLSVTCICAMNPVGEFIPPMLIYERNTVDDSLKKEAPANTAFGCSKNGCITPELFLQWLEHFIKYTNLEESKNIQMLLLLDGHNEYSKSLAAMQLAREYGIFLLSFPLHTTQCLQPLRRTFFKSLEDTYKEAANFWLSSNHGKDIEQTNYAEILGYAFPRCVHMELGLKNFEITGLWPFNPNLVTEEYFIKS